MANQSYRDVIVVGASAGGVEALSLLAQGLPQVDASIFVVVHTAPAGSGMLAKVLSHRGKWPAQLAEDGARFEHGHIYVAPPDRHLLLERDRMRLVRGPLENRHRPSIDSLFRSAAAALGPRVIGVVLTGYLDDGTAGAIAIKRRGGLIVVQEPEDALAPSMPESVILTAKVDYVVPLIEMPALLADLVAEPLSETEQRMAEQPMSPKSEALEHTGKPSAYTCPECNGTLWEVEDEGLLRFACRVGHAFTADSMMEDHSESAERALWAALRALEERADLSSRMAKRASDRGHALAAKRYLEMAQSAAHDAEVLRAMLTNGKGPQIKERHDDKAEQRTA
jgi:two-component system chemotaxis response regulator CheB